MDIHTKAGVICTDNRWKFCRRLFVQSINLCLDNKGINRPGKDWLESGICIAEFDYQNQRKGYFSCDMRFPTMWYVRQAKAQTSLRIRTVWSEPLLVAWIFYDCKATDWKSFGVSKLKRGLHTLIWVYTCENATLLEITYHSSFTNEYKLRLRHIYCAVT